MARVFLTTLGTNRYMECRYRLRNCDSSITPFVQEALVCQLCSEWNVTDRVIVFCTAEADKKNWLDQDQNNPEANFPQGLKTRLQKLCPATLSHVSIPAGTTEKEIMEIFEIVANVLTDGDEVILDITHSFRFLSQAEQAKKQGEWARAAELYDQVLREAPR